MKNKELAIIIGLIIVSGGVLSVSYFLPQITNSDAVTFYVLGDSQGYQEGLTQVVDDANANHPSFVFHCGDLTPFGSETQYQVALETIDSLSVPFKLTPGNHDVRLDGRSRYKQHFGNENYSFNVRDVFFLSFDTSEGDVPEDQVNWIERSLDSSDSEWKFVFTHMPMFDPRDGEDHSLLNETTASRLMTIFENTQVDAVFTGHIHLYNVSNVNGVTYVITGGAGASLVADSTMGGIFHYLRVSIEDSAFNIELVPLPQPVFETSSVLIAGDDEDIVLALDDLFQLPKVSGFSSFQNQLSNWRSFGNYTGIPLSTLVDLVGGINENQTLRVVATDGFEQEFCYENLYPNSTWYDYQGEMILAFGLNDTLVPEWGDGMRIVFLPEDQAYSINDCQATSRIGQGCNIYSSAGARWVRNVAIIEVVN